MPIMNASMLGIDTNKSGFKLKLTVMDASAMYNAHGGASVFQFKRDCGVNSRCTWDSESYVQQSVTRDGGGEHTVFQLLGKAL